jgi:hypothetical protein
VDETVKELVLFVVLRPPKKIGGEEGYALKRRPTKRRSCEKDRIKCEIWELRKWECP